MIEIDEPARRKRILNGLGGIEESAFLRVGGETIVGVPEADADRTSAEGKASSVQFVHFPFTADQIAAFYPLTPRSCWASATRTIAIWRS